MVWQSSRDAGRRADGNDSIQLGENFSNSTRVRILSELGRRVWAYCNASRCMTTAAISLELNGFWPVIKLPSTTTLEVMGTKAFL